MWTDPKQELKKDRDAWEEEWFWLRKWARVSTELEMVCWNFAVKICRLEQQRWASGKERRLEFYDLWRERADQMRYGAAVPLE